MAKLASKLFLKVHAGGQGKKNNKKPVLFPKLVFLYDENLHGPGKPLEDVFEAGYRVLLQDDVSRLAEPDRGRLCRFDVQKIRRGHQPDGLPRLPLPVV